MVIFITYSLWSLIRSESESRAHPTVATFSFHLTGREIFLPQAFVPTNFTLVQSMTSEAKKHIRAEDVSHLSPFMFPFASETSEVHGDLAPLHLCIALIHLLNDISGPYMIKQEPRCFCSCQRYVFISRLGGGEDVSMKGVSFKEKINQEKKGVES